MSGSGTERVLSFVRAVESHVPDSTTVKAAPLTQPRSPFFFRDFSPSSSRAEVYRVGVWSLSGTILQWIGNRGGGWGAWVYVALGIELAVGSTLTEMDSA